MLDLDIELELEELFSPTNKPQAPLVVGISNLSPADLVLEAVSLSAEDIKELLNQGPSRSYATVQHTRAYHHIAALKLASGEKAGIVAASLNLQASTISRLLADSQFQDLVGFYRNEFVQKAVNTYELMELVSMEAVGAIHERLIGEDRDSIPLEALRRIGETFADRTGLSPIRRSESLNVNASGSISDIGLERVKQRHGEDSLYSGRTQDSLTASFEKSHEEEALRIGAKGSISAIFESVAAPETKLAAGKG